MVKAIPKYFRGLPTPLAGLALGVASLGWCLENALPLGGAGQIAGAAVASCLLAMLLTRYALHIDTFIDDLKHPVLSSIIPTFAMALMVVSRCIAEFSLSVGTTLWCIAVAVHLAVLAVFLSTRFRGDWMPNMVPSWFVPPVGIIVADVSFPGVEYLHPIALVLLYVGMAAYAVMLPTMIYRLFFHGEVPNAAKPTIAIMAAPASLSLAGYLTVVEEPSLLVVGLLGGIAVLMTAIIYFAFYKLLRLQFSPGYAAFTFPMAIGATALYKTSSYVASLPLEKAAEWAGQIRLLAHFELVVAALVISYVFILYMKHLPFFMAIKKHA